MKDNWNSYSLGQLLKVKHGFMFKGEYFSDSGTQILLTPGNFEESGGFKYTPGKEKYYSGDIPKDYVLAKNDLVVAMTEQAEGLLGSAALVPDDNIFLHNQRIGLVSIDANKVDKIFLYYLFRAKHVRQQIKGSASGTKVKHTSPERIYDVKVSLPPLPQQKKLGVVLYSLESKINVNNEISATLEASIKSIYDYWFVQFDYPDDNGAPYKTSGGKMVYDKDLKREVPAGWHPRQLSELLEFERGVEPGASEYITSNPDGKYVNFYRVSNIHGETSTYLELKDKYPTANPYDVLVTFDGSVGKVGVGLDGVYSSGLRKIYDKQGKLNTAVVFSIMNDERIRATINKYATGSILMHASSSIEYLSVPYNEEIYLKYQQVVADLFNKIVSIRLENQELTMMRNWLLPMVTNGQVTTVKS